MVAPFSMAEDGEEEQVWGSLWGQFGLCIQVFKASFGQSGKIFYQELCMEIRQLHERVIVSGHLGGNWIVEMYPMMSSSWIAGTEKSRLLQRTFLAMCGFVGNLCCCLYSSVS